MEVLEGSSGRSLMRWFARQPGRQPGVVEVAWGGPQRSRLHVQSFGVGVPVLWSILTFLHTS